MTIEHEVAEILKQIALNEEIKAYVLQHPSLYQPLLHAARRFIGGETLIECVETARSLNQQGFAVTIDYMGESTRDSDIAQQATQEFLRVIDAIATQNLDSSISLDLSHIGLVIDPELAYQNACILAEAAESAGLEMMISMEGVDRTSLILEIHQRLCKTFNNVGITLQAYLHRTADDLEAVLQRPGKIRLVKGAYVAPTEVAKPRGAELDESYRQLMERLLTSRHPCSIATHDPALLDPLPLEHAHRLIQDQKLAQSSIEFEMLKGVAQERLAAMRNQGYRTRVYLPYGQEWHLYLCNRLAEYPPNIYQAIVDAAKLNFVSS
ncbi:proline dehydrogenase family protein [Leptolyngbya sp. NIES-2104]|uniref:proline dehydrogenase family protein n=1 Tax=Leptolyngbya sp. NIES-2104 TaxID=1552121 RepID=UPI0006EC54DB|nr:proline dehydrogenase family protein [Leptolyngbya sp. NIES-2104]GAQ00006.1 proline dehydrogenase [Leptolyngbya sp. NIES-2104]